jgi:hypothetical protein
LTILHAVSGDIEAGKVDALPAELARVGAHDLEPSVTTPGMSTNR